VEYVKTYRQLGVSAFVVAPMLRDGKLVSAFIVAATDRY